MALRPAVAAFALLAIVCAASAQPLGPGIPWLYFMNLMTNPSGMNDAVGPVQPPTPGVQPCCLFLLVLKVLQYCTHSFPKWNFPKLDQTSDG